MAAIANVGKSLVDGVTGGVASVANAVGKLSGKDDELKKLAELEDDAKAGEIKVKAKDGSIVTKQVAKETKKDKMKFGDYVIQVHVIECRDLKGRGVRDMSDPVAVVEVMGKKKSTKIHKQAANVLFDEILFFEFRNVYPNELERSKVTIKIMDANTIKRDVLIGLYEYDIGTVYYNKHHEVYRQWAALTDVTDKFEGVQGYLKASVVVLGPDDEQYTHPPSDADDENMMVLMPPNIPQTGKLLKIKAYEADGLPQMDEGYFGTCCDPFIRVDFAGIELRTKPEKGQNVKFLKELQVPVMEPIMSTRIRLSLYDWDMAGPDDRISTFSVDYQEIKDREMELQSIMGSEDIRYEKFIIKDIDINGTKDVERLMAERASRNAAFQTKQGQMTASDSNALALLATRDVSPNPGLPVWYNLYGAPEGKQSGAIASAMNRGNIPGTFYRGRVLLQLKIEDCTDPKKDVVSCNALTFEQRPAEEKYCLQLDLYEGSEIPQKEDGAEVMVTCGSFSRKSPLATVNKNRCEWYHIFEELQFVAPADVRQVPDVFVYLVFKKKCVSFRRFAFKDLMANGWSVPPTWHVMQEDPCLDALDDDEFPGALLFSLRVGTIKSCPSDVHPDCRPLLAYGDYEEEDDELSRSRSNSTSVSQTYSSTHNSLSPSPSSPSLALEEKQPLMERSLTRTNSSNNASRPKYGTLTVTVLEGANLPAMDRNGFSDPYVKLKMNDAIKFKTRTLFKTLSPKWGETFKFENVSIDAPLVVKVMDYDKIGKDELMGRFNVDLFAQSIAAKVPQGVSFSHTNWFLINDKFPNASIQLKIDFKFLSLAASQEAALIKPKVSKDKMAINAVKSVFKKKQTAVGTELGRPGQMQFQLRVHLFQARNLPASDSSGLSDPYVVVRCCGKKIKFPIKKETLNPQWFQSQTMTVTLHSPMVFAPFIQVFVMDWDNISKDDAMGRFFIAPADIEHANAGRPVSDIVPTWYDLYTWDNRLVPGEARVLMAFQLLSAAEIQDKNNQMPSIAPPTVPMTLEVTTLGLRDLTSTLGVHKTYLEFELPSGQRFKTLPSKLPSPKSPNFLQVLKIPVDLPTERIFAPKLDVEVRDILFGGLVKRMIGSTSLDLSDFMIEDQKQPGHWRAPSRNVRMIMSDEEIEREIKEAELKKKIEEELRRAEEEEAKIRAQEMAELNKLQVEVARKYSTSRRNTNSRLRDSEPVVVEKKEGEVASPISPSSAPTPISPTNADRPLLDPSAKNYGAGSEVAIDIDSDDEEAKMPEPSKHDKIIDIADMDDASGDLEGQDALMDGGPDMQTLMKMEKEAKSGRWDIDDPKQDCSDPASELPYYMKGRLRIDNELEDEMMMKPFYEIPLFTGQKNAGPFGDKYRQMGRFKGLVRLCDEKSGETNMNVKELLCPRELYVRLYILRGHQLTPKDSDGTSDPYLVIKLGKQKISLRDKRIMNTLNPDFFEALEIPCTIPGDSSMKIEVWDWDGVGDDFIGSTTIDLEDRYFTKDWRTMPLKPVEFRTLRSKSSNFSQGKLEMWMEIVTPLQSKRNPMLDIRPPPPMDFELRVIVWGVRDMTIMDQTTQQNDLFVTCQCSTEGSKRQETDTHFRSKKGKGNFNWRMKFPLALPMKTFPRLRFQVWDFDIFSPDDSICESYISLKGLCKVALKRKDRVKVYMKGKDRFWIDNLQHPNRPGNQGKMEISMEILPATLASQIPAGMGRSDPNMNPFLPEPEGRVNFSLFHPFNLLRDILGPQMCRKLACAVCLMALVSVCYFLAPMIFSNLITKVIWS